MRSKSNEGRLTGSVRRLRESPGSGESMPSMRTVAIAVGGGFVALLLAETLRANGIFDYARLVPRLR